MYGPRLNRTVSECWYCMIILPKTAISRKSFSCSFGALCTLHSTSILVQTQLTMLCPIKHSFLAILSILKNWCFSLIHYLFPSTVIGYEGAIVRKLEFQSGTSIRISKGMLSILYHGYRIRPG